MRRGCAEPGAGPKKARRRRNSHNITGNLALPMLCISPTLILCAIGSSGVQGDTCGGRGIHVAMLMLAINC